MSYFKDASSNLKPNQEKIMHFCRISSPISLYDLGSSGGTPPPFCYLLDHINLANFEPDSRANSEASGKQIPFAIGPKHLKTFHLNKRPTTSSLLPSNDNVISRYEFASFFGYDDIFRTLNTVEVAPLALDELTNVFNIARPDFLKVDVQGVSYEALASGPDLLKNDIIGIQIEVEFIEIYKGQKTFGHVHELLYEQGFEVFKLSNIFKFYYKSDIPLKFKAGQETFCDLLYFKGIDDLENNPEFWTTNKCKKAIQLLLLYDLTDPAAAYIERMIKHRLLSEPEAEPLIKLISDWPGAISYFFLPKTE